MSQILTKYITNNAVTNAKLAQAPANTLKGNNTAGTANVTDLTVSQVQTLLSIPTSGSPLPINAGGTGQSTATNAFNALAPSTAKGGLIVGAGSNSYANVAVGTDNSLFTADSTSTDGAAYQRPSNLKNYISNPGFESNTTTNWSLGTVGTLTNGLPTGSPTFGSGASGNLSISTVSSGQLAGSFSLSYASSAATTQGNMLATAAFTIDSEDQAKVMTFKFYYSVNSGAANGNFSGTSSNSFGVAIYDVTNSVWLSSTSQFGMTQNSGVGYVTGTCQTGSSTASIRFVMYNVNATTGATTLYFDDFYFGPQTAPFGPTLTDPVSYTPTLTGVGTATNVSATWYREGKYLVVDGSFTAGTVTAALFSITLPTGLTLDTTTLSIANTTANPGPFVGSVREHGNANSAADIVTATTTSSTLVYGSGTFSGANMLTPANGNAIFVSTQVAGFSFRVPIAGWSSNLQMSSDTDTRVVAMRSNNASATVTSSFSDVTWNTVVNDTNAGMGTTTYTVPVSGYYDITTQITLSGTQALNGTAAVQLLKNGSIVQENDTGYAGALTANNSIQLGIDAVLCNAGDTLKIQVKSSAVGPAIADATNGNYFCTVRRSGPSVIAATESVNMSYTDTAGASIGTSLAVYKYQTKNRDSHNAYSTSTGLYTTPVSGMYRISAGLTTASVNNSTSQIVQLVVLYNGSTTICATNAYGNGVSHAQLNSPLSISYPASAGDTFQIQTSSANATTAGTSAGFNWLSIERIGN